MEKCILKLIQLPDNRLTGDPKKERPLTTRFSILSDFDFVSSEVRRGKFINGKPLSCSFILQLTTGEGVSANLPVFHNLFSPDIIYNDDIEKICWSLKYHNHEIRAGKVITGHSFQFDWDLIDGINTSNNNFPAAYHPKNQQLEDDIKTNMEELGKHFLYRTT